MEVILNPAGNSYFPERQRIWGTFSQSAGTVQVLPLKSDQYFLINTINTFQLTLWITFGMKIIFHLNVVDNAWLNLQEKYYNF